jgi:transposase
MSTKPGDSPMGAHDQHDLVTIGVDPHKHSLTAMGLDERGRALARPLRVEATPSRFGDLQQWARPRPRRRWAVENASGLGRDLTQRLLDAGEQVLDMPAKLSPGSACCQAALLARPT